MKACGIIVEYNPFHNGHAYHVHQSRKKSKADCMIAVMSGHFLQRGEPAIIDKWHRTNAALQSGVDLVIELPYIYAVQHSDYFSKGAVLSLNAMQVDSICFGSENGSITPFLKAYEHLHEHSGDYESALRAELDKGLSYPDASRLANETIGLSTEAFDFSAPNNILGYSYVKQIKRYASDVDPLTIKRIESNYHDTHVSGRMASATSIRKELLINKTVTDHAALALPKIVKEELYSYYGETNMWHEWECYFNFLHYKIMTTPVEDLKHIHGMDEGLEYRLKQTIRSSTSFIDFMNRLKTRRYTWTRLQRLCTHLLTGLTKNQASIHLNGEDIPYVRVLGMNKKGQAYLNQRKKEIETPIITQPQQMESTLLDAEERATAAYLSPLASEQRKEHLKREYGPPVRLP
ncbi:nucleotidyltransferase [Halobacillus sp. B23F22_1]|uniref:nucleotidyltransferase n=1 Tax=Halobacillus sp. B23F22_1 TaxID=3459514 RepID=UPI00373E110A